MTTTKKKTLISFDVDGTLIHSVGPTANKLHKEAFSAAFKKCFDIDTTIDVVPHSGSTGNQLHIWQCAFSLLNLFTLKRPYLFGCILVVYSFSNCFSSPPSFTADGLILVDVLKHHGISHERAMAALPSLQQVMIDYVVENKDRASTGLEVLPGVVALLTALQSREDDVAVCLVTGNLQPIGWVKMELLGIKHLFTPPYFGGFGSDYCSGNSEGMGWRDRAELVRIAAERCAEHCCDSGGGEVVGARFHVGDAPMDVKAAALAGAHPIGVTTGIYSEEQLRAACPSATLLKGLEDVEHVLRICNLS